MTWQEILAVTAIFPPGATVWFVAFWRWFDFWRRRRVLTYLAVAAWFAIFGAVLITGRSWTLAGRLDVPTAVQVVGWSLVVVATVFGTIADRQIGIRVRSFTPFFETHGRIELKTTGAYGVVRHPIYSAGSAFGFGVFFVTGYPAVLAAVLVWTLGALWFTREEEKQLVALLDDPSEYERYRARVPALLPRIRAR